MSIKFQILDVDYTLTNSTPCIRFFGRTDDNKSITVFYDGFLPYFYVLPTKNKLQEVKDFLENNFQNLLVKMETKKKFLPIGYYEKPISLLKITLNNPSKVPLVRDQLKTKPFVKQIFEADILFRYRFMIDHDIFGMRWYEVEGKGIMTNTVKTEKKIRAESFKEVKKEDNITLKHLSFDIETLSKEGIPDAENDPIIIVSLFFYPAYKGKNTLVLAAKKTKNFDGDIKGFSSEKDMLQEFVRIINDFDPDILLGYNVNNFDLPYIETRLRKNTIPRTIGRCTQKAMRCSKFMNRSRTTIPGRVVVDVYELIKEATKKFGLFKGLKRYGLGDVSEMILGEGKVDVPHSEIVSHWEDNNEKFQKLLTYSRKDAELPIMILFEKHMLDKFLEICKVSGIVLQDALNGGESSRIENLLLREFNKRKFVLPNRPTDSEVAKRKNERRMSGLKGGFVLKPEVGFHDRCVVYLDFRSMYPSIMISFNICPTTLLSKQQESLEYIETPYKTRFISPKIRKGILPQIVEYLITTRSKIKKQMKSAKSKEKKRYLYAKQYAFKTVANAFYGYTGYIRARVYVLDIANTITKTGRDMIGKTKEIVESKTPYKVIYSDTDSTMVKLNTKDLDEAFKIGKEVSDLINKELHHILEMKIESIFKTLVILSKKRYAGWNFEPVDGGWDESIITKGIETVRRDWCDLVSETLREVLDTILKEQDVQKSIKIVKDKVEKIKTGNMDIDKLIITKSISKSLKTYKGIQPHVEVVKKMRKRDPGSAPGVGDRIGFVIVKGMGMISHRAEDPEYVKEKGLQVDPKYYIESQLLPPLERVFLALNVKKSDLTDVGKQMGIFEAMKNEVKVDKHLKFLRAIDGVVCDGCGHIFRRVPLSGRCSSCSGEIVFYQGDNRSKVYNPWTDIKFSS